MTAPYGSYANPGESFTVNVPIQITPYVLTSIVTTAIESGVHGSGIWCEFVDVKHRSTKRAEQEVVAEWLGRNVAVGGTVLFRDGIDGGEHVLTREKLISGLKQWIALGYYKLRIDDHGVLDASCIDGPAADMIVQLGLFNGLKFG